MRCGYLPEYVIPAIWRLRLQLISQFESLPINQTHAINTIINFFFFLASYAAILTMSFYHEILPLLLLAAPIDANQKINYLIILVIKKLTFNCWPLN